MAKKVKRIDCLSKVLTKFPDLKREDLEGTFQALTDASKRADYAIAAAKIKKRSIEEVQAILEEKASEVIKRKELIRFVESVDLRGNDIFRAKTFGVSKSVTGGNVSFEGGLNSIKGRIYNMLSQGLNDLIPQLRTGEMDLDVADAIIKLHRGESISGVSEAVRESAKAIKGVNDHMLDLLRSAGISIKQRGDYITRQTHDPIKLSKVKKEEWVAEIKDRLSDETFDSLPSGETREGFLGGIYDEIIEGGVENTIGFSVKGKRSLHFKNGKSWAEYNSKFGKGTLLDTVVLSAETTSKMTAAARIFGPNPKNTYEWLEKGIAETLTGKERAKFNSSGFFSQGRQRLAWKNQMFGHEFDPSREWLSKTVRNLGVVQAISKLGTALGATVSDTSFSVSNFKAATGTKGVQTLNGIKKFFSVLKTSDRNKIAARMDMYFGDLQAEVYDRMGSGSDGIIRNGAGFWSRTRDFFMSATLLEAQSSRAKTANAKWFAGFVHDVKDMTFKELDPSFRFGLERFDISSKDWDAIRQGSETIDGKNFWVSPARMREMGLSPEATRKYSMYIGDMARVGSPEASIRERAMINQGLSSTDPMGAGLRLMLQFKSFALAQPRVFNRVGETAKANGGRIGYATATASLAASAYMFHMGGQAIKDVLKGKETKFDEKFFEDSFANSVLPLSAQYTLDMIRGEYKHFGRSIFKDIAGPTFGQLADVENLLKGGIEGTELNSKTGMKAFKILQKNLPGYNMPIAGPMLNYIFMNSIYEMLEPGYSSKKQVKDLKNGNKYYYDRSASLLGD